MIIHGDCIDEMKKLKDNSIDLCLTDPPYGIIACKWDSVIPFEPMWLELKRIVKYNGAIALFGSEPFSSALRMSNIKMFKYDWIWEKSKCSNILQARFQPLRAHEIISIFTRSAVTYTKNKNLKSNYYPVMVPGEPYDKGVEKRKHISAFRKEQDKWEITGHRLKSSGERFPRSCIKFRTAESEGKFHPTQKPVLLLEYLIKTYTKEDEIVLDFTMGSGSTGVACKNLNRKFIGIEKDKGYFKIANQRINRPTN